VDARSCIEVVDSELGQSPEADPAISQSMDLLVSYLEEPITYL
jgi:hypothetical protein